LQPLFDRTVTLGQTLSFQAVATDSDIPAQTLRFALINFPSGASIDAVTGRVTWTPTSLQTPSTNSFTVRVTDDGVPPLSSSHSFAVRVAGPPRIGGITPPVAGALTLTVPVIPGKTYRVEYKDNLNAATWSPLGGDRHPATETLVVQDNLAGGPQRFYRVVILD
jgi:hypothetical protein